MKILLQEIKNKGFYRLIYVFGGNKGSHIEIQVFIGFIGFAA